MADLLAEAGGPAPAFAAVVCEDINRSARDTFDALKLEKELAAGGITLFATNEPVFLEGANATTILLRRMKQRHRRVLPAADQRGAPPAWRKLAGGTGRWPAFNVSRLSAREDHSPVVAGSGPSRIDRFATVTLGVEGQDLLRLLVGDSTS